MSGPVKNRVGTNVRGNECPGFILYKSSLEPDKESCRVQCTESSDNCSPVHSLLSQILWAPKIQSPHYFYHLDNYSPRFKIIVPRFYQCLLCCHLFPGEAFAIVLFLTRSFTQF